MATGEQPVIQTEPNVRFIIPLWAVVTFFAVMNTTMFNVSLPAIIADLDISQGMGAWVLSGYSITFALATVIASRLTDMIPIRVLLVTGIGMLGTASIGGIVADRFAWLLVVRVIQAMGAGTVLGIGVIMARRLVPFDRRGRALAVISAGSALSYGVGPVAGGLMTDLFGWNGLFLITCLVLPLAFVLWRLLPKEQLPKMSFDFAGAFLTAAMVICLLLALSRLSALFLVCGLLAAALNIAHLLRARKPFVDLSVLRVPGFPKLLPVAVASMTMNLCLLYLVPLMLDAVHGRGAGSIGFFLFPGAVLSVFLSRFVGRWIDCYGPRRVMLVSQMVMFAAVVLLACFGHLSMYAALLAYLLFAPGFSALVSATNFEISTLMTKEQLGSGMGLTHLLQFNGGAFGMALCGVILDWQRHLAPAHLYKVPFFVLVAILGGSAAFLIWYLRSGKNQGGNP